MVEFYYGYKLIAAVYETSMIPTNGSVISIRKKVYKITNVSFAVDNADGAMQDRILRCCVDLTEVIK